jgi:sulfate adenylyltransferase subunit 1 (EFTu-like GTPase family)
MSRATGGFILIDETSQDTVAAGMVVRTQPEPEPELEPEDGHEETAAA